MLKIDLLIGTKKRIIDKLLKCCLFFIIMVSVDVIRQNLETFSFPRIYGSDAEKKAHGMLKQKIRDLNLPVYENKFTFSNFYSIIYGRVMFLLLFWILIVLYINMGGIFQTVLLIIPSAIIITLFSLTRKPDKISIGENYTSQNIFTTINGKEEKSKHKLKVLFLAHIDTKGQRFNITHRVRAYLTWMITFIFSLPIVIINNVLFIQPPLKIIFYIFGGTALGFNLIAIILLFLNTVKNHSDGALDNASGVACLLELLDYYSIHNGVKLNNIDLWFIFTGAEECGTMGIRNFYQEFKEKINDKTKVLVINFDSIGTAVDLIKFGVTRHKRIDLFELIREKASQEYAWDIKTRNCLIGVHTDGYYLFKKGFDGIEFGDWESYKYLHSINDTIDKVDPDILKKTCEIVQSTLNEIDSNYNAIK